MTTKPNNGRATIVTSNDEEVAQVPAVNTDDTPPAVIESQLNAVSRTCLGNSPQLLQPWAKVAAETGGGFTFTETITITEEE